ncbi:SMa0974 family conjugal transfer regulator [Ochrobactrum quorumnocens]|uniref:SMa0974 family conjugal transfer regulator n=1 Tax=Ochrobactrum quorumnocens TaxID=271865 RepID=UPI000BA86D6A
MYIPNYTAETFIDITNPEKVGKTFCLEYRAYIVSVDFSGHDKLITFGDGRAILSPTANGLHLRVEAFDLATFHGIWSLLQVGLDLCKTGPGGQLEWTPSRDALFPPFERNTGQSN